MGSDNGFAANRQTNILLIWLLETWNEMNFQLTEFYQNSNISINESAFENVVGEMSAILSRPKCVKQRQQLNMITKDSFCNQCLFAMYVIMGILPVIRYLHFIFTI